MQTIKNLDKTDKSEAFTHKEGPIAKAIEKQTAKLPSDLFLWLAIGSMAASATLQFIGQKKTSNFIGLWVPTFLIFGVYNKLVKVGGSDKLDSEFQTQAA